MSKHSFVHLHFHTAYSLLDGACQIGPAMDRARELGMSALAMTDHGALFGAVEFYQKAKASGIKPLLGCEVYVASGSRHDRTSDGRHSGAHHLVLLAENEEGWSHLMRLVSTAYLEGFYYKPRIDKELLAAHHRGLIGLSACLKGEVAELCAADRTEEALHTAGEFADILGRDCFFLELQDHGLPEQRKANRGILDVARRTGLPLVATNDVHYLEKGHAEAHDIMLCLQTGAVLSEEKRMRYGSDQFYMKSAAEMGALFSEAPDALANTVRVAERCNVTLPGEGEALHFPVFHVPDGGSQREMLLCLGREGLRERYRVADPDHPADDRERAVADRFHFEMSVIEKTGFVNYFLVVSDFVRHAKDRGIPVGPGRGSGAGSLVAYALGITGIDPLAYGLVFERFLNPERVNPPDFDIDFCQSRRGEVIQYVREKYGRENVAQIVTFVTLGARTVLRDIGRVLELPFADCDRLARMVPEEPGMTLDKALEQNPEFRKTCSQEPFAQRIMSYARVLEGLPRQTGTHAAGVVIGEKPLIELVPLARDKEGETITQYEMKPLEAVGLLKMDFLGLKTLTVIQESVDLIRALRGEDLRIDELPMDDPESYDLLNRGDTVGVFQLESRGMRDLLRRIGLRGIEELIAMIALYRPGPMNMLEDYVRRKHGKVKITYDHPLLEPILKETYGVMLYQEQVLQAVRALAGFTFGQGDILRRAMGKKNPEVMAAQRARFVKGCHDVNRIPKARAEQIFDTIQSFAGYGFNKSHSTAYGLLSFQTAYLKAHYPAEFMAALLSSEIGNNDKLPILIAEAQAMGLEVRPPDLNESGVRFTPSGQTLRFGLAGVKNVGTAAVEALVREREAGGPFRGLIDFCSRLDGQVINRKVIESLVKCGAFDFTELSRGRLFNAIDFALGRAAAAQQDRRRGQITLFEALGSSEDRPESEELPPADPWPTHDMLRMEKELLGFYVSGHPLKQYEWALEHLTLARVADVPQLPPGQPTRVGGLVTRLVRRITKQDRPMASFRLEGLEGDMEVVAFSAACEKYGERLSDDAPVMVCGTIDPKEPGKLLADEIHPLEEAAALFATHLDLHVPSTRCGDDHLAAVKALLDEHPGPTPVKICLEFPNGERVFLSAAAAYRVTISPRLIRALQKEMGEDSVYVEARREALLHGSPRGSRRNNGWRRS